MESITESSAGQAVSQNGSATRTLGQVACREKRAQRIGAAAVRLLGDL
jgi:hypothetical protein